MGIDLRYPNITGPTEREQLSQMKSYLFQMVEQLNLALQNVDTSNATVVNPPMKVDVEYKTTERYMGKPVYTKLIYCDTLPNNTYKLFPHGAAVKQAIRCVGQMSDGNSLPFHFNATNWVEIYAGPEYVVILTGNDKTNQSAYAQLWYVKD